MESSLSCYPKEEGRKQRLFLSLSPSFLLFFSSSKEYVGKCMLSSSHMLTWTWNSDVLPNTYYTVKFA